MTATCSRSARDVALLARQSPDTVLHSLRSEKDKLIVWVQGDVNSHLDTALRNVYDTNSLVISPYQSSTLKQVSTDS